MTKKSEKHCWFWEGFPLLSSPRVEVLLSKAAGLILVLALFWQSSGIIIILIFNFSQDWIYLHLLS